MRFVVVFVFAISNVFVGTTTQAAKQDEPPNPLQAVYLSMDRWSDVMKLAKNYLRTEDVAYLTKQMARQGMHASDKTGIRRTANGISLAGEEFTISGGSLYYQKMRIDWNPNSNLEVNVIRLGKLMTQSKTSLLNAFLPLAHALGPAFLQIALVIVGAEVLAIVGTACGIVSWAACLAIAAEALTGGAKSPLVATCEGNRLTITDKSEQSTQIKVSTEEVAPDRGAGSQEAKPSTKKRLAEVEQALKSSSSCQGMLNGKPAEQLGTPDRPAVR